MLIQHNLQAPDQILEEPSALLLRKVRVLFHVEHRYSLQSSGTRFPSSPRNSMPVKPAPPTMIVKRLSSLSSSVDHVAN